jgi:cellulose synthase (UDP-forming)
MTLLDTMERSLLHLAAVGGAALVIPVLLERERTLHRAFVFAIAAALGLRYAWWRASETLAPFGLTADCLVSWSFFALEMGAMTATLSVFVLMCRTRQRSGEADRHAEWWAPGQPPRIHVLVATYNEDEEVLERTLAGAAALDYPNYELWVCDDGQRDWIPALAARFGARVVTREGNAHAKAGNINNALRLMANSGARPDFVAILDADFVPHRNFLSRALSLFHSADVALVQTPQHFFNPDPIQNNLGLKRSFPDEQRFFFHEIMRARDAWGIAFCCGTSSIIRFDPLEDIGFFPTSSVTEDFLLTLALREAGWRTVYLDEPLTEGLAPEGVKEYLGQRARWCLGQMQIARGAYGPFSSRPMRLRDRWSVMHSVMNWTCAYAFRVAALVAPLLYWYFDILVVDAEVNDVISHFGAYYLYTIFVMNFITRGRLVPLIADLSQSLGTFPILGAAFTGLFKPKGHPFRVTAKGGDRSRVVVQWALMRPHLILLALTVVGLLLGIVSWRFAFSGAGDGTIITLYWSVYNAFVLGLTILACIELPRADRHVRDAPERVSVEGVEAQPIAVWMRGLTVGGARLRGVELPPGHILTVTLRGTLHLPAEVVRREPGSVIVRFMLDEPRRTVLLQLLHAEGGAPNVMRPRAFGAVGDILIRLATGRP